MKTAASVESASATAVKSSASAVASALRKRRARRNSDNQRCEDCYQRFLDSGVRHDCYLLKKWPERPEEA